MGNLVPRIEKGHSATLSVRLSFSRWFMLPAILCVFTFHSIAQPQAFAALKPERVETGDTFLLSVIVSGIKTAPKSVDFVSWSEVFPAENILSRTAWRQSGSQWIQQFTLIAFDSAVLSLPSLTVLLPAGKPLVTNSLSLNVYPTRGADLRDMEPVRDIIREPVSWMDYWTWGAGTLAIILLGYWWIRKSTRRPQSVVITQAEPLPPALSASESALKKLRELQSRELWKKGQVKEHHAMISLIVREYLEVNYGIAALESTTAEILKLVTSTAFPDHDLPGLKELLHKTDMVKYAQSNLPDAAHEAVLEKARELVSPMQSKNQEPKKPVEKNAPNKSHSGKYEPL